MATRGVEAAEAETAYQAFLPRDGQPPALPLPRLDDSRVALLASDKHMKPILQIKPRPCPLYFCDARSATSAWRVCSR